jgi:uncharacterized membrane protein HdeD (DUF308 family)
MEFLPYLFICLFHWIADFILQTDWQAKNKSKAWKPLLMHTGNYSVVMGIVAAFILPYGFAPVIYFVAITFLCHTVTDYVTSRINARLWGKQKVHLFFVSVGFDQLLHYAQLFITYDLLK